MCFYVLYVRKWVLYLLFMYYLFVSDRINLVMLMMMEGPERGLAYAQLNP